MQFALKKQNEILAVSHFELFQTRRRTNENGTPTNSTLEGVVVNTFTSP